jgi:hypothetical protein
VGMRKVTVAGCIFLSQSLASSGNGRDSGNVGNK